MSAAIGLVVAAGVVSAFAERFASGPIGLSLLGVLWVLTPSARTLNRRLAINGSIGLGAIPLLWWVKLPVTDTVGRVAIVIALGLGFLAFRVFLGPESRRDIFPGLALSNLVIAAVGLALAWLYVPFVRFRSGVSTVSMITGPYGNDNVAHFDMFEMIRRLGVVGPGWPIPPDGSIFAYVPYPQHFHVFAAMIAESWLGPSVGTVDQEVGAFGIALAVSTAIGIITLIAAIASLRSLANRPGLVLVCASAVMGFAALGLGSQSISDGFPNFLLATLGATIGVVIASDGNPSTLPTLLAASSLVVLVAHSWSLLTPIGGLAWLVVVVRLPWRSMSKCFVRSILEVAVIVGTLAAVAWAAKLVFDATRAAGGSAAALATPGAGPVSPFTATLAIALGVITLSVVRFPLLARDSGIVPDQSLWACASPVLTGLVALTSLLEGVVLIVVQFSQVPNLAYFQYKFINGIFVILGILAVIQLAEWISSFAMLARTARHRVRAGAAVVLASVTILVYASPPANPGSSLSDFTPMAAVLRSKLAVAATTPDPSTERKLRAASIMRDSPCARPIFVDPEAAVDMAYSNQWAMSLSSTWTEGASEINNYIYQHRGDLSQNQLGNTVSTLLDADSNRCVVMSPLGLAGLEPIVKKTYASRLLTWKN